MLPVIHTRMAPRTARDMPDSDSPPQTNFCRHEDTFHALTRTTYGTKDDFRVRPRCPDTTVSTLPIARHDHGKAPGDDRSGATIRRSSSTNPTPTRTTRDRLWDLWQRIRQNPAGTTAKHESPSPAYPRP